VLIEGKIDINRQNAPTVVMDKPLTIYNTPSNQPAKAVAPVDSEQLGLWALETELDQGQGVISADGPYRVNLASLKNPDLAFQTRHRFHQQGYAAETYEVEIDSTLWTRLAINGFATRSDAEYFVINTAQNIGVYDAWYNLIE
jgi:hypothetical protein